MLVAEERFVFLQLALQLRKRRSNAGAGIAILVMRGEHMFRQMASERRPKELMRPVFFKQDMQRHGVVGKMRELLFQPVTEFFEQLPNVGARTHMLEFNRSFHPPFGIFLRYACRSVFS